MYYVICNYDRIADIAAHMETKIIIHPSKDMYAVRVTSEDYVTDEMRKNFVESLSWEKVGDEQ